MRVRRKKSASADHSASSAHTAACASPSLGGPSLTNVADEGGDDSDTLYLEDFLEYLNACPVVDTAGCGCAIA
jgi:hypothetical protein